MKVCALNIGHGSKGDHHDPGAINKTLNITEYDFNHGLADLILNKLVGNDIVVLVAVYQHSYTALTGQLNAIDPNFILSLHANSFDTTATGSEFLYAAGSIRGAEMAEICRKHFDKLGLFVDRGIKSRSRRTRGGRLLHGTIAPCVICEPFFLDNDNDLAIAIDNMDEIADTYCNIIVEIARNF